MKYIGLDIGASICGIVLDKKADRILDFLADPAE